jgi:hypothetical protein
MESEFEMKHPELEPRSPREGATVTPASCTRGDLEVAYMFACIFHGTGCLHLSWFISNLFELIVRTRVRLGSL